MYTTSVILPDIVRSSFVMPFATDGVISYWLWDNGDFILWDNGDMMRL